MYNSKRVSPKKITYVKRYPAPQNLDDILPVKQEEEIPLQNNQSSIYKKYSLQDKSYSIKPYGEVTEEYS